MNTDAMPADVLLRPATAGDLGVLADVHLASRSAAGPAFPPGVHTPDEVRDWVAGWDLATYDVWVAVAARPGRRLRQVHPDVVGRPLCPPGCAGPGHRQRPAGPRQVRAAGRLRALGLRDQRPRTRLLRPPRLRRAGAHGRLGQRGAVSRHQDGLAGQRTAGLLPVDDRRRRPRPGRRPGPPHRPHPRRTGREALHPARCRTGRRRSRAGWPRSPPSWARSGSPASSTPSSPRRSTPPDSRLADPGSPGAGMRGCRMPPRWEGARHHPARQDEPYADARGDRRPLPRLRDVRPR